MLYNFTCSDKDKNISSVSKMEELSNTGEIQSNLILKEKPISSTDHLTTGNQSLINVVENSESKSPEIDVVETQSSNGKNWFKTCLAWKLRR